MSSKWYKDASQNFRQLPREKASQAANKFRNQCSKEELMKSLKRFVPIIDWLPKYDWKGSFFSDMSGGLSMAVLAVPQGIALAGIAGVEPVYGLYTAIFPAFLYMFFGNSKYTALGGMAILSLMTRSAINKVMTNMATKYNCTHLVNETAWALNETDYIDVDDSVILDNLTGIHAVVKEEWTEGFKEVRPIHIATTIMFISGILHILMGIFRLDFLSNYCSEQIMSGFVVGGSVHVLFAQIGDVIGVELPKRSGRGYLYHRLLDIVSSTNEIHVPTLIISLCSVSFLLFSQFILHSWFSNVFDFPIPYELILVIVGITATNFADLSAHHSIKVVGNIPTDFPPPSLPRFDLIPSIFPDSCSIALVAVAIHLTIVIIAKQRYHYNFENWRELYSLGFVGVFSSFFPVFPVTSVFARSVVGTAVQNSTQMTVCFSSLALLAVVLYIGPALEYLPKCILASMVIVSLIGSFKKILEARKLWPTFKCDLLIFGMSAILTICLDMCDGLIWAVIFALFTIIVRNQSPKWHILTRADDRDYKETSKKDLAYVEGNVCVLRFDGPLIFTSVEKFSKVVKACVKRWEKRDANTLYTDEMGFKWRVRGLRAMLVIDCSGFSYVDHLGLNTLKRVYRNLEQDGVVTKFAAPKAQLARVLRTTDFFQYVPREAVFDSVRVAVHVCERHYAAVKTMRIRSD